MLDTERQTRVKHESGGHTKYLKLDSTGNGEDWSQAWTLEDYILSLLKNKQHDSPEFKTFLKLFGRDKFTAIWNKYRDALKDRADHGNGLQEAKSHH